MKPTTTPMTPQLDTTQGTALLCLTLLAAFAFTGSAHARLRSTTVTGPQGQSASRVVNRAQGDVSSSTTGPRGRNASRQVNREPGSTQATVTDGQGNTYSRSTTHDNGSSNTTVTGPQGESATVSRTVQP